MRPVDLSFPGLIFPLCFRQGPLGTYHKSLSWSGMTLHYWMIWTPTERQSLLSCQPAYASGKVAAPRALLERSGPL